MGDVIPTHKKLWTAKTKAAKAKEWEAWMQKRQRAAFSAREEALLNLSPAYEQHSPIFKDAGGNLVDEEGFVVFWIGRDFGDEL